VRCHVDHRVRVLVAPVGSGARRAQLADAMVVAEPLAHLAAHAHPGGGDQLTGLCELADGIGERIVGLARAWVDRRGRLVDELVWRHPVEHGYAGSAQAPDGLARDDVTWAEVGALPPELGALDELLFDHVGLADTAVGANDQHMRSSALLMRACASSSDADVAGDFDSFAGELTDVAGER
jgi:hypothetical protein